VQWHGVVARSVRARGSGRPELRFEGLRLFPPEKKNLIVATFAACASLHEAHAALSKASVAFEFTRPRGSSATNAHPASSRPTTDKPPEDVRRARSKLNRSPRKNGKRQAPRKKAAANAEAAAASSSRSTTTALLRSVASTQSATTWLPHVTLGKIRASKKDVERLGESLIRRVAKSRAQRRQELVTAGVRPLSAMMSGRRGFPVHGVCMHGWKPPSVNLDWKISFGSE